ncbi:MAG: glycoside hydrolase family 31 protein [Chitinophagales bacterium]
MRSLTALPYCFLLCFVFCCSHTFAQHYQPVANAASVVSAGNARFTVLSEGVIRMEYSADTVFNDQATITILNRNLPAPAFKTKTESGWLVISTSCLTLSYKLGSGPFNKCNLKIDYADAKHTFSWKPGMRNTKNLHGTTRTLDGTLGQFSFQTLKKINTGEGLLSRNGWALINDSEKPVFDTTDWPWVQNSATAKNVDWYFFGYGSNYKAALYDFTLLSGKIALPPKFAFGIWYSRYYQYSEQDFKDIVAGYESHGLPLDVLVIDMDWHMTKTSDPDAFAKYTPQPDAWTGFTWTKKYFPDYQGFLKWTDTKNIRTCLNLHPASGVQPHEATYCQFANAMGFDTAGCHTIPFDITNKQFAQNYFNVLLHPYEKAGVDFWWLDWQQYNQTKLKGVNPTFYLNYVHFSDMQRQGKRPLIFHRYGGLGNQRYQIGFSGDVVISWKSLAYQPWFTATAANVGFGFWSHDIGGHMQPINKKLKQNAELFTRWVQWGAFSPIFRTHATNDPGIERRMWQYPTENFEAMKKVVLQRYSLIPYIYTYSRMAYDSAISLVHPMYYEYPDKEEAYRCPQQYYFGKDMIVAPIFKALKGKQAIAQTVWLPEGNWYDYRNNNLIEGDRKVTLTYTLNEIPVFVKQGSIIPQQYGKQHADEPLDTIILSVYCGANGSFNLYEDDGATDKYRERDYSFTSIKFTQDSSGMQLSITPDGKHFTGQLKERVWEIRFINCEEPKQVVVNGKESLANYFNDEKKLLAVSLTAVKIQESILVSVK